MEEEELNILERILANQPGQQPETKPQLTPTNTEETKEVPTFKPHSLKPDQGQFEKIVARLLYYNEKIN
jgi:hypothetical protein